MRIADGFLEWFPPPPGSDHVLARAAAFRVGEFVDVMYRAFTKRQNRK